MYVCEEILSINLKFSDSFVLFYTALVQAL